MALNNNEAALVEAVAGFLRERAILGLPEAPKEVAHTSQFRWESVKDAFALKLSDSAFYESLTSAFHQVHSYKYVDHPTFCLALEAELKSRAVPTEEINKAIKVLTSLVEGLSASKPSERDAGWNPQLDEIADMTRNADSRTPKREAPFTGGGPWAEAVQKDALELMIVEGIIPEADENVYKFAWKFVKLQDKPWLAARSQMMRLAEETANSYKKLSKRITEYIDIADAKSSNSAMGNL